MSKVGEIITSEIQDVVNAYKNAAKALITPVYNAKGYGAKGDGVTDDANAIQAAIDAAAVAGGTVVVPAGSYRVNQTISMKRGVTLAGLSGTGRSVKGAALVAHHAGDIVEFDGTAYTDGGIENLRLAKAPDFIYTGAGVRVVNGSWYGWLRGIEAYEVEVGLHGTSMLYWRIQDCEFKRTTYGIWLDSVVATAVTWNNLNVFELVVCNSANGVGYGLYLVGNNSMNTFKDCDFSGCKEAIVATQRATCTFIDTWFELDTALVRSDLERGHLIFNGVNNAVAGGVDFITSTSTNPGCVHLSQYVSGAGSGKFAIGRGLGSVKNVFTPGYSNLDVREGFASFESPTSKSIESLHSAQLNSLSLGSPSGGFFLPTKNWQRTALNSWSGTGTVVTGVEDVWGGAAFDSLNGLRYAAISSTFGALAGVKVVFCLYVQGKGRLVKAKVQGAIAQQYDEFYIPDDNWHTVVVTRTFDQAETGTNIYLYIQTDGVTVIGRPSLYRGNGCALPTVMERDTTEYASVQAVGDRIIAYGTTTPTLGKWSAGDMVINTTPTIDGVRGWTCTTAGAPGTWIPFGQLYAGQAGKGPIVTTPDGTKQYRIAVDDAGAITTTLIT